MGLTFEHCHESDDVKLVCSFVISMDGTLSGKTLSGEIFV